MEVDSASDASDETEWSTDLSADDSFGDSGMIQVDVAVLRQIVNHEKTSAHDLNKLGYCLAGNPKSTPFKGLPNKQKKTYRDAVIKMLDEQLQNIDRRNCNVQLQTNEYVVDIAMNATTQTVPAGTTGTVSRSIEDKLLVIVNLGNGSQGVLVDGLKLKFGEEPQKLTLTNSPKLRAFYRSVHSNSKLKTLADTAFPVQSGTSENKYRMKYEQEYGLRTQADERIRQLEHELEQMKLNKKKKKAIAAAAENE